MVLVAGRSLVLVKIRRHNNILTSSFSVHLMGSYSYEPPAASAKPSGCGATISPQTMQDANNAHPCLLSP